MATATQSPRDRKKDRAAKRDSAACRYCRESLEIDYKDVAGLAKLVTSQGKHYSRKRSGNCAKHQRQTRRALKQARFIGLMPFCG